MKCTTAIVSALLTLSIFCCENEEILDEINAAEDEFLINSDQNADTESGSVTDLDSSTSGHDQGQGIIYNGTSSDLIYEMAKVNGVGTIIIRGEINLLESVVIPSGITLDVYNGGFLNLSGTSSLHFEGSLVAGAYPIFNSSVSFLEGSQDIIRAEWFGNDDLAVNYALLSAGSTPVELSSNIIVDSSILLNSDQTFIFTNATLFSSSPMTGGAVIKNRNPTDSNITVVGGLIDGSNLPGIPYDAILMKSVDNALIQNVVAKNVHTTASLDTGNFHLVNCTNSTIQDVEVYDTWKMGIKVDGGKFITINGGYFTGTHDSGIGAIDSPNMHVNGVYVDNCGTSDASNITMNLQDGIFENSISINAPGVTNGNGLTIGHEGYPAFNSIIRNNLFINNRTKGVWSQGSTNYGISIINNIVINNGIGSQHPNSAGITVYFGGEGTLVMGNEIIGNVRGVNLADTSSSTTIIENRISNSILYGIDNDAHHTTVIANDLDNNENILNGSNSSNLTFEDNDLSGPSTINYNYLRTLSSITALQKEVLYNLFN